MPELPEIETIVEGAKEKFGFDVDHDSILSDRKVFAKFKEVLAREKVR